MVYAITDGTHIKIGVAKNPFKRIKQLSTGSSAKLTLIGYFDGSFELEKQIHAKHQKVRENGEWLYVTDELVSFLNEAIQDKFIIYKDNKVFTYPKIKNT